MDTTGNPIDNGSHNTSYPNDPNDAGKVTNPIIPNIPGKTPVDKNGNPLTPGNNYPIDGSKPTEDTKLTYVDSNQKAKVSYVDSTTGKTLEIVDLSGQPQSTSNYRTTDTIKKYTDQGYKLVNDNYPASGVKFNSDDKEQDFTVTLEHKVDTVTPENPGIPGQPINPDNPNGPKWPNGTDKDSLSKAINQTINYVDGNGKIVHDPSHDQVTFSRTATVDEVTGQVTYTDWNNASETFSPKVSPVIPGYVLRDDSQKTISGITVNPSSSDNSETVIYDKVGSLVPVDTNEPKIPNSTDKSSPVEPETGIRSQKYDVNTGLLAKIIILISGLLFLTRKKKND
ncbi:Cell division protein DamX [Fructobacillus cardui]|nr:Cell division protein DamX [Fructobacillus cardui]